MAYEISRKAKKGEESGFSLKAVSHFLTRGEGLILGGLAGEGIGWKARKFLGKVNLARKGAKALSEMDF